MYEINYSLLGSVPQVNDYLDLLPRMMEYYQSLPDSTQRMAVGQDIALCGINFYGIDLSQYETVSDLIVIIKAIDQELEFS